MSGRYIVLIVLVIIVWISLLSGHRNPRGKKIRVPAALARLAGSKTSWVDMRSFAIQLGTLTLPLWALVFRSIGEVSAGWPGLLTMSTIIVFIVVFDRYTDN